MVEAIVSRIEVSDKSNSHHNMSINNNYVSKSFKRHDTQLDDTYAKYVQFRTLHQGFFFTNEKLTIMGIKQSPSFKMF